MTGRRWCWRCGRLFEAWEGTCPVCNSRAALLALEAREALHPFDLWWVWAFSRDRQVRLQALPSALDKHRQHSHLMTLHRDPGAFARPAPESVLFEQEQVVASYTATEADRLEPLLRLALVVDSQECDGHPFPSPYVGGLE